MTSVRNLRVLWLISLIHIKSSVGREFLIIFRKFSLFYGILRAKFRTVI